MGWYSIWLFWCIISNAIFVSQHKISWMHKPPRLIHEIYLKSPTIPLMMELEPKICTHKKNFTLQAQASHFIIIKYQHIYNNKGLGDGEGKAGWKW